MKRLFLIAAGLVAFAVVYASEPESEKPATLDERYEFTVVSEVAATPVPNQNRSGTCWSFAANAFLESELLRRGKGEYDLSEMWIVRNTYIDKAEKFVRLHGKMEFAGGGAFIDVFNVYDKYGMVPEEAYPGLNYGTLGHDHSELDAVLAAYVNAVVKNPGKTLTPAWKEGLQGILDAYLGAAPAKFIYNGKEYTPQTFAASLGLDTGDYISLTSFTHHPFYQPFIIEVPDNWAWEMSWNLPLDEFMSVIDHTIESGYSVCWGADVSEKGFLYAKGFAVVAAEDEQSLEGTELSRWVRLPGEQRDIKLLEMLEKNGEMKISQEIRQAAFDNFQTTDDHGMLITGIARDQRGNTFYKVKNSWGSDGVYGGYFYASRPFVEYKTINIIVHKDAIPASVRTKLGI
ncbi:MAG: aminopeptidase [Rikenellaceae bacterium]|nr:aminopeptidase [Rikenellaceae bacterium]